MSYEFIEPKSILVLRGYGLEALEEQAAELKKSTGCTLIIGLPADAPPDAISTLDEDRMRELGWVRVVDQKRESA